ncbi:helix-turn-helix domain-containing protein [Miniphocaeibacter halophilus]|uniref:Helix-turn-helix transcriptional regulator n=1 Tax=Miniphocaeibacter halophilus TaxID=2931922 RepID=A0AC61MUE6_9FIRM|nr:helix-turn-helix transcriptional regulator [Miniphocaeibacter halophilus]QQK08968.1 helix-turn-helix transcriptional regulator [Miniphocaeibacter halophilus]
MTGSMTYLIISIGIIVGIIFLIKKSFKKFFEKYIKPKYFQDNIVMDKKPLNEVIKENRIKNKMTQEFIAEKLGVSRQAVSKWENGNSEPTMGNLILLANLFDLSLEELLRQVDTNIYLNK